MTCVTRYRVQHRWVLLPAFLAAVCFGIGGRGARAMSRHRNMGGWIAEGGAHQRLLGNILDANSTFLLICYVLFAVRGWKWWLLMAHALDAVLLNV